MRWRFFFFAPAGRPEPLPLGEVSAKQTERASPSPESRRAAISRPFVRAILSLCFCFLVAALPSQSRSARQGRVAAPSVCFAAARILLAAAPTATPCFRRWRRSSLLLLSRGGFGIPENFISSPEAPLGRGAVERSETERLRQAEPYPLYLLCARPSLPSMMSVAAAAMSGQRSARALASSGGNLPSTQSAKS